MAYMCMDVGMHVYYICVEYREQLSGISCLLPPCKHRG